MIFFLQRSSNKWPTSETQRYSVYCEQNIKYSIRSSWWTFGTFWDIYWLSIRTGFSLQLNTQEGTLLTQLVSIHSHCSSTGKRIRIQTVTVKSLSSQTWLTSAFLRSYLWFISCLRTRAAAWALSQRYIFNSSVSLQSSLSLSCDPAGDQLVALKWNDTGSWCLSFSSCSFKIKALANRSPFHLASINLILSGFILWGYEATAWLTASLLKLMKQSDWCDGIWGRSSC